MTISVATDSFWDDIAGIIYLMTFDTTVRVFPTSIGYASKKTTKDVCGGLLKWVKKMKSNIQLGRVDSQPLEDECYFPLDDPTALEFGASLSKYLKLKKGSAKFENFGLRGDILILGPYNGIARKFRHHHHRNHHHNHQVFSSFSNLRFPEDGSFPSPISIGFWSNAGIDPCSAMRVWGASDQPALLLARQPPIDLVISTVTSLRSWGARKITKVLNYSKLHNPGGGYVWDLGLALVYKNPDIITKTQLYEVTKDPLTNHLTLTSTSIRNPDATQVYLVDVDLNLMMERLRHQLK